MAQRSPIQNIFLRFALLLIAPLRPVAQAVKFFRLVPCIYKTRATTLMVANHFHSKLLQVSPVGSSLAAKRFPRLAAGLNLLSMALPGVPIIRSGDEMAAVSPEFTWSSASDRDVSFTATFQIVYCSFINPNVCGNRFEDVPSGIGFELCCWYFSWNHVTTFFGYKRSCLVLLRSCQRVA